ncbi:MAG: type II secretion system protein [Deltaproteobacteria bacterium]|nr:type II secretion system protein [Deltaproteobacteria bacterium]
MKNEKNSSREGFTLIETLVAISILGISLVVILQLFSGGLRSGKLSDEYTRAIFYAREKMEEALIADNLTEEILEGEFEDGFRWKTETTVDHSEGEDIEQKMPFSPFIIKVKISWESGIHERSFEISTMKVGAKPGSDEG